MASVEVSKNPLTTTIPIVDFEKCALDRENISEADFQSVGKEIFDAFASVGFVYLKNTGVSKEQIDLVNDIAKQFYDLDANIKRRYARDPTTFHGYDELGKESTNPERPGDYKEAYNINGYGLTHPDTPWPDEYVPGFSKTMREFSETCRKTAATILEALSFGLEVKDKKFLLKSHSRMNGLENSTGMRALYYPPILDDSLIKPQQLRLGEHSDYGSITLLFQDDVGGLQIEGYDGKYVDAAPIPDTMLVNIGDALQFWTKGRLKSTKHRIVNPADERKRKSSRRSLVYFVHPDYEVMMSEMEYEATSAHRHVPVKCEYEKPVTAYQHIMKMYKNSYG